MPQIPAGKPNKFGATTAAPSINVEQFGKVGDALQNFGTTMTTMGADLLERQTKSTENDYILKKSTDDILAMQEFNTAQQAKIKSAEDAAAYPAAAQKFIEERTKQNLKEAPTKRAAEQYTESATKYQTREMLDVNAKSHSYQGMYKEESLMTTADKLASSQITSPNPKAAREGIAAVTKAITGDTGVLFDPPTGMKIQKNATQTIALGMFQGYLKNDNVPRPTYVSGIKNAINELNSEAPDSLAQHITPSQKATLLGQYNNALEQEAQKEVFLLGRELGDKQAALADGISVSDNDYSKMMSKAVEARNTGALDADSYERLASSIKAQRVANGVVASIAGQPVSKWASSDDLIPKDTANYRDRDQISNAVAHAKENEYKRRIDDFPKYAASASTKVANLQKQAMSGDPQAVASYISEVDAMSHSLEIPQSARRVLSKDFSGYIGNQISTLQNPAQKAAAMQQWQQSFGSSWARAATDMVKDKQIPADYLVASYMTDEKSKASVFANTSAANEISAAFKKNTDNITDATIEKYVRSSSNNKFYSLLAGKGNDPARLAFANAYMKQIVLEVKSKSNGSVSQSDVDDVHKKMFKDNFTQITGGNSDIVLPKGNYNAEAAENIMSMTSTKAGLGKLKVMPPPGGKNMDGFLDYLGKHSYWDASDSFDSIVLKAPDISGLPATVMGANGKPIRIPLDELGAYESELNSSLNDIRVEKMKNLVTNTNFIQRKEGFGVKKN